jgi:hypothetical protein
MKKSILVLVMFLACCSISAQVGIGTPNPNASAVLDLNSTTKGLLSPRLTTAQRNAIVSPVAGLIIYNTTKKCIEWYDGTVWYNGCGNQDGLPSSGGTAVVSGYSCGTASVGTLEVGTEASGVTQTITASVDKIGTYAISATANGVTFSGSGTFLGTGSQKIVLTATGTLTVAGSTSYVLSTTPNCSFIRSTVNGTSGGTAIISGYNCSDLVGDSYFDTYLKGVLVQGIDVRASKKITVAVATIGTYNISATANGVTFSKSGTFNRTGEEVITLYAAGVPAIAGSNSFTLNTTPNCSFNRATISSSTFTTAICDGSAPTTVVPITTATGKTWMDRNLGASRQATSLDDIKAYGCLYQWGRGNDGHASMKWYAPFDYATGINGTTDTSSLTNIPGHSLFITSETVYDWIENTNNDLWQGVKGANNPCPTGYRIPTALEFREEIKAGGYTENTLKFAGSGWRKHQDGKYERFISSDVGPYYTSTVMADSQSEIIMMDKRVMMSRNDGMFVRCIKD